MHNIGDVSTAKTLSYKVEYHRKVCKAKDNPKNYQNFVHPNVVFLKAASHKVSEANSGQGNKTVIEPIKKRPFFEKCKDNGRHDEKDKKPRDQGYETFL